ncbi:response regulator transcription factor [Nocardioides sp. ChNu-153]|uniref:helix-turn-helix transcriptional regulator n=1 Tax=unclassified Nocardioides TaxID=2615069 RepID=UPI0024054F12|nr:MULTISPECIES: LuxR C-terminal-related transcriptional regulator [unclassified Nocardioides]MDF9715191.1 LuxR C-terminal-related transcriptional regulator [Nocardioides sp. ChNu-99]MDN7121030.1 response regulator transcription factor [Nocardioides sp. ChNu-153]
MAERDRGVGAGDVRAATRQALGRVRRDAAVSLAFAGRVEDGRVTLDTFDGRTVGALAGTRLQPGHGLGGRVITLGRAHAFSDYLSSRSISHRYDAIIAAEGLRAMAAVPVVVGRRPVAVLYGALHAPGGLAGRALDVLTAEARALEQELVLSRATPRPVPPPEAPGPDPLRERVRAAYADLRLIAGQLDDPRLRDALLRTADTLAERTPRGTGEGPGATLPAVALTPREADVLGLVALGHGNARIGAELGLTLHTVKGYVKAVMAKLGASTRLEAAVLARRHGLLP